MKRRIVALTLALIASSLSLAPVWLGGCAPSARSPSASNRSPQAQKWFERASAGYATGDMDDAWDSVRNATREAPKDPEVLLLAGRIALARLDFDEAVRQLKDVAGSEARGLRGRADWYAGRVEAAADELEAMLQDPDVRDPWAKSIAGLARRGVGRKPFEVSGGIVAMSEMARLPNGPAMIVPVEIDGEEGLAMVATGTAEVTLDSATRKEPSWISLRFGGRVQVKDVPAVVQDLSSISRQLNAPIKALLGVNLLRHLNPTIDYTGGQFVVRTFVPPPPPGVSRVPIAYIKGGGMVIKSALQGATDLAPVLLLLDTAMPAGLALDENGWKKAGVPLTKLEPAHQDPKLKRGTIRALRLGSLEIEPVNALFGTPIADVERGMQIDLDGVLGTGILGLFRITLADEGRTMWLEDLAMPASNAAPGEPGAAPPVEGVPGEFGLKPPGSLVAPGASSPGGGPRPTPARPATPQGDKPRGPKPPHTP